MQIYRQKPGGSEKVSIAVVSSFNDLFDNQILIKWSEKPSTGTWQLVAEVEVLDGTKSNTGLVTVEVQ